MKVEFYENCPKGFIEVEHLSCVIRGVHSQLKSLKDVKAELEKQAISLGCSAIIGFKYGQRDHAWWEFWWTIFDDNMSWYGEGIACKKKQDVKRNRNQETAI